MELRELPAYIRENVSNEFPINEVARLCFRSGSKFKLDFKKAYGESFGQYVLRTKLYVAADMLTSGKFTYVYEVGHSVGWTNLSHFAKQFRKFYGYSPDDCFIKYDRDQVSQTDTIGFVADIAHKYKTAPETLKQAFETHFGVPLTSILASPVTQSARQSAL